MLLCFVSSFRNECNFCIAGGFVDALNVWFAKDIWEGNKLFCELLGADLRIVLELFLFASKKELGEELWLNLRKDFWLFLVGFNW